MLPLIWLVLCLVVVCFALVLAALRRRDIFNRYSGGRPVTCPENRQPAVVGIDAERAAGTRLDGHSDLRLRECTRWPERARCNQACLSDAILAEPYTPGIRKGKKPVYHLPVLLAAFAAWCLGAFWHSQYLFRPRWTSALGLTRADVKQIGWSLWPHLLTFAVCLLFAYGVAWLLAVSHRKGVLPGVLASGLLGVTIVATAWYDIGKLPHDLLVIEAGYAALAMVLVGTIVGGLYGKLVLRPE